MVDYGQITEIEDSPKAFQEKQSLKRIKQCFLHSVTDKTCLISKKLYEWISYLLNQLYELSSD